MADPVTNETGTPTEVEAGPRSILSPAKLKRHGATVVLAADEVKTSFTVDFTFSTTQSSSSKLNLGNLHRLLFQHMLEAAEDQTIRLLPTQENRKHRLSEILPISPASRKNTENFSTDPHFTTMIATR